MHIFLFLACQITIEGKIDSPSTEEDTNTDSGTSEPETASVSFPTTFYTEELNNQLYDVAYDGENFLISNPFYGGLSGGIYRVDVANMSENSSLEDAASAIWEGDAPGNALGVTVRAVTVGTETYVMTNQFLLDNSGNFLAAPVSSGSGPLSSYATLSLLGEAPGDFLGTGSAIVAGQLVVSATARRRLYVGDASLLAINGSIADMTVNASIAESTGPQDNYNFMTIASGSDGAVLASYGGIFQHITPDGTPDWWFSETADGVGLASQQDYQDRSVTRICTARRLESFYGFFCFGSRNDAEGYLVDPGGALLDTVDYATDMAESEVGGQYRLTVAMLDDFGGDSDMEGYIEVRNADGQPLVSSALPFETPYVCIPRVASNGAETVVVICESNSFGAVMQIQ